MTLSVKNNIVRNVEDRTLRLKVWMRKSKCTKLTMSFLCKFMVITGMVMKAP